MTQAFVSLGFRAVCFSLALVSTLVHSQSQSQSGSAVIAARAATDYSANVATEWFQLALLLTQQTPGFSPPVASRALAYMGLALYESVVPGMPQYQSLAGQLNELKSLPLAQPDEPLHWPTVANASLATMTRIMFASASAENKARIDLLQRSLPLKYSGDFDPSKLKDRKSVV